MPHPVAFLPTVPSRTRQSRKARIAFASLLKQTKITIFQTHTHTHTNRKVAAPSCSDHRAINNSWRVPKTRPLHCRHHADGCVAPDCVQWDDRFSGIPGEQRALSGFLSFFSCPESPLSCRKSPPGVHISLTRTNSCQFSGRLET